MEGCEECEATLIFSIESAQDYMKRTGIGKPRLDPDGNTFLI